MELPYGDRVKPFGFLLSAQVATLGYPGGAKPTAFHLIAPFSRRPGAWGSKFWVDAYAGGEYGISIGISYVPGVVSVKSIATVKAEFLGHGEVKSATTQGDPAGADSRGLLERRHVSPSEIRLIGKESNSLELVEAGLVGEWSAIRELWGE